MRKKAAIVMALMLAGVSSQAWATSACPHYAGHIDLEGKIGNQRNIGEAAAFLPLSCTQDRLLFTDLRFKADNASNREANIGLGGRVMHETGVVGGYLYFDRKKSGETDAYYNQMTAGAEWLAQEWEMRANAYAPLTGSKKFGAGVSTSAPYLQGSGIYVRELGFLLEETPLYGLDVESGFRVAKTGLWLYGGAFGFKNEGTNTIAGPRLRARYDFHQNFSVSAEAQYDDERGRQGWLGARLRVPLGTVQTPSVHELSARMVQSPVRDVDIVTTSKVIASADKVIPVVNTVSGDAQRVIYVDNSAVTNGDGSLEKPYNTLSDAQADLRDYDVVYVYHGDGTSSGMNDGFVIDKSNVLFLGEGSAFVYDGGKFATPQGTDFSGVILRPAGDKPVISNQNTSGNAITIDAANVELAGVRVERAQQHGVLAQVRDKTSDYLIIRNVEAFDNNSYGVVAGAVNSTIDRIIIEDVFIDRNERHGLSVMAYSPTMARINEVHIKNTTSNNSGVNELFSTQIGALITAGNEANNQYGSIGLINIENFYAEGNKGSNLMVRTRVDSEIEKLIVRDTQIGANVRHTGGRQVSFEVNSRGYFGDVEIKNVTVVDSVSTGVLIRALGAGGFGNVVIDGLDVTGSYFNGLAIVNTTNSSGRGLTARVLNSDFYNNRTNGVFIDHDGHAAPVFDVSLNGNNRLFDNSVDLMVDLNGSLDPLDARNNWWGQSTGPNPGQIASEGSGAPPDPDTGLVNYSDWLIVDPRP